MGFYIGSRSWALLKSEYPRPVGQPRILTVAPMDSALALQRLGEGPLLSAQGIRVARRRPGISGSLTLPTHIRGCVGSDPKPGALDWGRITL